MNNSLSNLCSNIFRMDFRQKSLSKHVLIEEDSGLDMDKNIHKHLPMLLEMAHDRTESGRVALAERVSEVFLSPEVELTHKEEALVGKLIDDLLQHNNPVVRQALIDKFAGSVYAPRNVAVRIAQGSIEIAQGVLATNENLNDEDLISIVQTKTEDHAAAVAARRKISEAVADALVTTGSIQIMYLVAENLGAQISPKALDLMIEAARFAALLQKPILSRPELTAESALRIFWWVESDARRMTLDRFGFNRARLDAALDAAIGEKLKTHAFESFDNEAMEKLADWLEERQAKDISMFPVMLRMGHYKLFYIVLGRMHELDASLIKAMVERGGGRMLSVLCRALNVEKSAFISIFLMARGGRSDEHIVHPRELGLTLASFDRLTPVVAQGLIDSWRVKPDLVHNLLDAAEKNPDQATPLLD